MRYLQFKGPGFEVSGGARFRQGVCREEGGAMGPPVDPGQSFGGTGGPGAKPLEAPRFYGFCRVNEVFKFIFL